MPWYKGNLHCHSSRSDGKANPVHVAKYYKFCDYDFLGISDHNRYTDVTEWAGAAGILGIPTCEYTGEDCCHVLAVGVREGVKPGEPSSVKRTKKEIFQDGIDKTLKAGGIPVLCHPNWHWTFGYDEAYGLRNFCHFEICNASPDCNSFPIPGYEPGDNMWDKLLTKGIRCFGLANDDAHEYYSPYTNRAPYAALGYNVVKAKSLSVKSIVESIKKGHFYASTGIEIKRYFITEKGIDIAVNPICSEMTSIQFFGSGGKELQRTLGTKSFYKFKGDEAYVRIRIASTAGLWAWTQPVFMDDLEAAMKWVNSK